MNRKLILCLFYVLIVLVLDLLVWNLPDFSFLDWKLESGFDAFKFVFWFIIPSLIVLKANKFKFFLPSKINRVDLGVLIGVIAIGLIAIFTIPHIEVLKNYYVVKVKLSDSQRFEFLQRNALWILSWAIGWEVLFRSFLFNSIDQSNQKMALWLFPLIEGLYHFQKPFPEIIGMVFFSFFLTYWTLKRSHVIYAIVFHLIIEFELIFFLLSIN